MQLNFGTYFVLIYSGIAWTTATIIVQTGANKSQELDY